MSVPLTLLGLLEREPSHGYDLKRDYDTYFGRGKPLPYGQVYATLSRLARDGMAIAGIIVGFGWVALLVLTIALDASHSNNGSSGVVNPAILLGQLGLGHLTT